MNNINIWIPISDWEDTTDDETESQSWELDGVETVTRRSKELDEGGVAEVATDTLKGALSLP